MKSLIIYSSATGNTKKLAEVIASEVEDGELLAIQDVKVSMLHNFDMVYVGYWVDKGDLDAQSCKLAQHLNNTKVVLFGTLGAAENTAYYAKVKQQVETHFQTAKIYGHFLCQGSVQETVIERYRKLAKEHAEDEHIKEQLRNYENGKSHPDENDLKKVSEFASSFN